jgi:hypothetical protein
MDFMAWQGALYSVWTRTIGSTFNFFPQLLGAIFVAILGIIIGNWVKTMAIRSLQMIRFEKLIQDTKFKAFLVKAEVTQRVEEVIGNILKWLIVLTFIAAIITGLQPSRAF